MTSAINTNGINVNYPVPGQNNSTQGFRDNFTTIKTNLDTASTEISDLQNSVVVKQALPGTTANNDMANTLISNALTRTFRATTYNLGNNLSGIVKINVSDADVQYGTITANTTLQFGGWAPAGTQSKLQLVLTFSNNQAVLNLPSQVVNDGNYGAITLENYQSGVGNVATVTAPSTSNVVDYVFTTLDCGSNIFVEQVNRPRQTTQISQRNISYTGLQGDVAGTTATDPATPISTVCTLTAASTDYITCDSTTGFYLDMPIVFTGNVFGGISAGIVYYVRTIVSATEFTISLNPGTFGGSPTIFQLDNGSGTMTVSPATFLYIASSSFGSETYEKTSTQTNVDTVTQPVTSTTDSGNLITITNTSTMVVNYPVTFSASFGNLFVGTTYYVKNVVTATDFTVSTSIGGPEVNVTTSTPAGMDAVYTTGYSVEVNNVTSLVENMPVIFSGTTFGNVAAGKPYYINNVDIANTKISISETCYSGIAGQTYQVTGVVSGTPMTMTAYEGTSIFNTVVLTPKIGSTDAVGLDVIAQNFLRLGVENNITATGTTKANAYPITKSINNITNTPALTGLVLPIAVTGMRITVRNGDSIDNCRIYPNTGGAINNLGVNVSYSLTPNTVKEFFCVSGAIGGAGGQWYTY